MNNHTARVIVHRKRVNAWRKAKALTIVAVACLSYGAAIGTIFFLAAH